MNKFKCIKSITCGEICDFRTETEYDGSFYGEDLYICDNSGTLRFFGNNIWKEYFVMV